MRLCFVSDTHLAVKPIAVPECDVLLHSGDALGNGTMMELQRFCRWLDAVGEQVPRRIYVAGNHDWPLQRSKTREEAEAMIRRTGTTYLRDSECVLPDGTKVYGSPWQPEFYSWAFNLPRGIRLDEKWKRIPEDTDILLTHGPPKTVLDHVVRTNEHVGCDDLLRHVVNRVKPAIHAFGHIHCSYGMEQLGDTLFLNASLVNERYQHENDPIVVEWEDGKATVVEGGY